MKKCPLASIFIAALSLVLLVPAFVSAQSNDYWRQQQQQMIQQQRWQQQQDDIRRQAAERERERERQRQIEIERQRQIEIERQRQVERQRQIEIERQRQTERQRQQQIEQARRQQVEQQQKRQAEEVRRQHQAQQRGQQQTAEQHRQQMRIQAMLGTTRPTQVMKAPRNPTPGEIQKGFTGRVTADGRALVKFQNRVLTVPASRISGLSAKLANDNQRKSNWTPQQQSAINARIKAVTQGREKGGKSLVLLNPPINISSEGIKHVNERHSYERLEKFSGKSVFNKNEDIPDLIQKASQQPIKKQPNGNWQRTVDIGRLIGFDRTKNAQTSIITVITKPNGDLVTAFPGEPEE